MCQHDELILQKIASLDEKIQTHTEFTQSKLSYIEKTVDGVLVQATLTNSRVDKLENQHAVCPINTIVPDYNLYKSKMRPVYVVATNWKMIVGVSFVFGIILSIGKALLNFLIGLLNIPV